MGLTVIIPWAPASDVRGQALDWVLRRWTAVAPDIPVHVAISDTEPWVKANAVMPAVARQPEGTVVIVSDADVWCDGSLEAARLVATGHPWAVPHRYVRRLTQEASRAVYAGTPFEDLDADSIEERAYIGVEGGGVLITTRERLLEAPFDSRFKGWGGEDQAVGYALRALYGAPWRGELPCWHLWHEPQQRISRALGNPANETLRLRYLAAQGRPDMMRVILDEAREAATWPR